MKRFGPVPFPNLMTSAPFPRVFQGVAGLSLTNLGFPMRSRSWNSLIISVARNVVQLPFMESVSSTATYMYGPKMAYQQQ